MSGIQREDILEFIRSFELSGNLKNSKFLITGSTGLIGSTLVRCLHAIDDKIQIVCPVRNLHKARLMYEDIYENISFIECDMLKFLESLDIQDGFQYIVHCASPTSGRYIIDHPVETYMLAIDSTRALLEYARRAQVQGLVYVSSLEYYGQNFDDRTVAEDMLGFIDYTNSRNSYSLGKRAAEFLCVLYSQQYNVNVRVARLTQTFGAGVAANDSRVFAQFARSIISGTDIIMHTKGESAKPYCYTTDCVSAILYILLKGKNGEAYNVANSDTYISIRQLAEFFRDNFNPSVKVLVDERTDMGYAPVTKLRLSSDKLNMLGWKPKYGLKEMCERLIADFNSI